MSTLERLQEDMKSAMRARDQHKVDVLRMGITAIKNAQMAMVKAAFDAAGEKAADTVDRGQAIPEQAMQDALTKEVRKRREAAELFRKGGRNELAENEEAEAAILEAYLPKLLTADELRPQVQAVLADMGVSGMAAMSKVMPVMMQKFKGQADGRVINQVVRELLSQ
ncbi:MAG: GatB/YqeY domain-containing protein [Roseiflexaceae bacterium]